MATKELERLYAETMLKFGRILKTPVNPQSNRQPLRPQNSIDTEEQCEFCRTSHPSRYIIEHHIVPEDIIRKAGLPSDRTIPLCFSCHRALHHWNVHNVSWVHHESEAKRYRAKSLAEVAQGYESAYSNFIDEFKKSYKTTYTNEQKPGAVGILKPVA